MTREIILSERIENSENVNNQMTKILNNVTTFIENFILDNITDHREVDKVIEKTLEVDKNKFFVVSRITAYCDNRFNGFEDFDESTFNSELETDFKKLLNEFVSRYSLVFNVNFLFNVNDTNVITTSNNEVLIRYSLSADAWETLYC